jgi:hypothetical protein
MGGSVFDSSAQVMPHAFWGMLWTMVTPLPVRERAPWDKKTMAVMKRLGISGRASNPGAANSAKSAVDGFQIMAIIHIYNPKESK